MSWLSSLQDGLATVTSGNGLIFALIFAGLSAAVAIGGGFNRYARQLLLLSVAINILYWLAGQGLGGIFQSGATDPNAAPLFILMAYAIYQLVPYKLETRIKT